MSINSINVHSVASIYNANSNKNITNSNKNNKPELKDRIEISSIGKSIKNYSLDSSIDNSKKIEEIREKIEKGTYSVDSKLTARRILDTIKESKNK